MRTPAAAVLLAVFLARFAAAQQQSSGSVNFPAPFGVRMAASKTEVGKIAEEIAPFMFRLAGVPKPHADFETYIARITPKAGVCFVKALSRDVPTSVYGSELKTEFDRVREQIESVYGKSKIMDHLRSGSIWDEPRDWMMGLLKDERVLLARWSGEDGLIMKYGIKDIYLAASATSQNKGYLALEYHFDNKVECDAEVRDAQKSVF